MSYDSDDEGLFVQYKLAAHDENAAVSRLHAYLKADGPAGEMRRELTIEMLEAHERVCVILEQLERLHLDR
jgi:hypothetical protein